MCTKTLPFRLMALLVLAGFYAVYFIKMLRQRRRGIRTNQIGRRREKTLHRVELLMKCATYAVVPAQLLSVALDWSLLPCGLRLAGFAVGLLGDGIFLAAVLCMKDSWRAGIPENDRTSIVTTGIYAVSRNPAFLGFDLMYLGVLLLFCNPLTAALSIFAAVMLHLQILQEERYLPTVFGAEYAAYRRRVRRYLGADAPDASRTGILGNLRINRLRRSAGLLLQLIGLKQNPSLTALAIESELP